MSNTKRMADHIAIKWSPTSDDGTVSFNFNSYLLDENGDPTEFVDPHARKLINETINKISRRIIVEGIVDPITGETLPEISGAGLVTLIKTVVDQVRNEMERDILIRNNSLSDQSVVTVLDDPTPADGTTETTITVQLKTNDGSLIEWGGYDVTFSTDVGELVGEIVDNDDGTYTQNIKSFEAGEATIEARTNAGQTSFASTTMSFTETSESTPTPTPTTSTSPTPTPSGEQ